MTIRLARYCCAPATSNGGMPKALGTTVLLQHNGLPRTPFYAQLYLQGQLESAGAPSSISGHLASLRYRISRRIQNALQGAGDYLPLAESHRRFGDELERKLQTVLPEYGPFRVMSAYAYDTPSIREVVDEILSRGTDRLIITSLYPFETPNTTSAMKKATNRVISKETSEVYNLKLERPFFVVNKRPVTFDLERVDDLGSHVSFVQYWSERLFHESADSDAVIFAVRVPSPLVWSAYSKKVHEAAKRTMYTLYARSTRAVPYRVAFYTPWDHNTVAFPIRTSVPSQIKALAKFERHRPLVVPFGSLFRDFDSEHVLPTIVAQKARVLRPTEGDSNPVHSFVELLKSRILTARYQAARAPLDPLF